MPGRYKFNRDAGLYRDGKTGKLVPAETVRGWIEKAGDRARDRLGTLAKSLQSGKINNAEWVTRTADELKLMHRAVAMAAAGGKAQMTQSDWGFVGGRLQSEFSYLNAFASEIDNLPAGSKLTDGFIARARSYANASFVTYEKGVRRRVMRDGMRTEEQNQLEPGVAHCAGCQEAADQGRVPIGTLVDIGDRDCGPGCRCSIIYFKAGEKVLRMRPRRIAV